MSFHHSELNDLNVDLSIDVFLTILTINNGMF